MSKDSIVTKRKCAGEYKVTNGERTVFVSKINFGYGDEWVAAAEWDNTLYTDPLPTKREAVYNARLFIIEEG